VHCTWLTNLSPRTHSTRSPGATWRPQALHADANLAVMTMGLEERLIEWVCMEGESHDSLVCASGKLSSCKL
jgi:hypothetical protein